MVTARRTAAIAIGTLTDFAEAAGRRACQWIATEGIDRARISVEAAIRTIPELTQLADLEHTIAAARWAILISLGRAPWSAATITRLTRGDGLMRTARTAGLGAPHQDIRRTSHKIITTRRTVGPITELGGFE